jgi:hypothetical protein
VNYSPFTFDHCPQKNPGRNQSFSSLFPAPALPGSGSMGMISGLVEIKPPLKRAKIFIISKAKKQPNIHSRTCKSQKSKVKSQKIIKGPRYLLK